MPCHIHSTTVAVVPESFESIALMFTLETLGGLILRNGDSPVTGRATQRRRLALLAILAAERRPISRDKVLGLLWPEIDGERARHLLADSLYVLRAGLGEDVVINSGDHVALNEERVASDVASFEQAMEAGRLEQAVSAYSGPFLDGIFISDAPSFERWTDSTRNALAERYRRCLEQLANQAAASRDYAQSVTWWRALIAADPLSSRVAIGLIRALTLVGDRGAALQFARQHDEIIRAELDSTPDPAVLALVAELRVAPSVANWTSTTAKAAPVSSVPPRGPEPTLVEAPHPARSLTGRHRRSRMALVGAVGAIIAIAVLATVVRARRTFDPQPAIAVLPFESLTTDSEAVFIAQSITELLTDALHYRLGNALRVIPSTSSAAARKQTSDFEEAGKRLDVRYLIDGSIGLSGGEIQIATRLVDAKTGAALSAKKLQRLYEPASIIEIEDSIVVWFANQLDMSPASRLASFTSWVTHNPAAIDPYSGVRHLWASRNPAGIRKPIDYSTKR